MEKLDLEAIDPKIEPVDEKFHRIGRAAIGAIPIVGSPLLEIFNSLLEAPLNRRRTETMLAIGMALNDLIDQGIVTEVGLQENEAFVSTVAEVCSISLRNHQAEKLEALRNAVVNSALPTCPSDDYRQIFLNFIDVCTVTHIRLLKLFEDPELWFSSNGRIRPCQSAVSLSQIIFTAMPELVKNREIIDSIWADLYQKGLVEVKQLEMVLGAYNCLSKQTTQFGSKLVAFLS